MRLIFVSLLGLSEELNELHNRTYEAIVRPAVQSMELQGQFDMPETIPESNIAGFGAATINDPLHIPDGIQSDALLSGANDACGATPTFGLQIPPDNQVNGASNDFVIGTLFQGVTEPFIDNEKEVAPADREHAQVDTLYSDRLQDVPSDLQRSTDANVSSQDVALDNSGQACAHAGDDMTGEFNHFVHSNANIFESNEVPASEITGVEYNQDVSGFPRPTEDENAVGYNQDASGYPRPTENENAVEFNQDSSGFPRPTEDENAVSAMGDNSGFQENNMGSLMDLDMVNDYELKECNVSPFTHIQNLQML